MAVDLGSSQSHWGKAFFTNFGLEASISIVLWPKHIFSKQANYSPFSFLHYFRASYRYKIQLSDCIVDQDIPPKRLLALLLQARHLQAHAVQVER